MPLFLREARRLLSLADTAATQARRIQAGSAGSVSIGFTATSTFGILTRLLDLFGSEFPDIHLDLHEMVTREQIAALLARELDLGLARPPFDTTAFASRLLHREALILAVPSGHRLAHQHDVAPDDVANEPLIMYSPVEARYFYDLVVRMIPVADKNVVHSVSQVMTMLWLVAGGRGIAFVPQSAARLGIPDVEFVTLDRPAAAPGRTPSAVASGGAQPCASSHPRGRAPGRFPTRRGQSSGGSALRRAGGCR